MAATLALLLAACGGSEDGGTSEATPSEATPTSAPEATTAPTSAPEATTAPTSAPEAKKETVIFSDLNWPSAEIQARVASYIVEHGYGYPVGPGGRETPFRSGRRSSTTTRM